MDNILQDLRYAARALTRSPGFTLVAVSRLPMTRRLRSRPVLAWYVPAGGPPDRPGPVPGSEIKFLF